MQKSTEFGLRLLGRGGNQTQALGKMAAPHLGGVTEIPKVNRRCLCQKGDIPLHQLAQRLPILRRKIEQPQRLRSYNWLCRHQIVIPNFFDHNAIINHLVKNTPHHACLTGTRVSRVPCLVSPVSFRGFLKHHMRIRATNAKGADTGTTSLLAQFGPELPLSQRRIQIERRLGKVNIGVGGRKVDARRQLAMVQCQDGFDKAGDPCGGLQMADVTFHRTDGAAFAPWINLAKELGQGGKFNHIADRGPRAVGLNVREFGGGHPGDAPRLGDDFDLAHAAGGHKAKLARAIIVDCRAAHHRPDQIAIRQCLT